MEAIKQPNTWLQYVRDKRTVVFCASVKHAEQIAELFREEGIRAASVSGSMKQSERKEFQDKSVGREVQVLCACDLLNEGWDCPETEVLFMARPTMSKVLYRDSRCYPLDALKSLKQSEKMQCEKITKQLGLPLYIHQMLFDDSDVQQVREYILGGE